MTLNFLKSKPRLALLGASGMIAAGALAGTAVISHAASPAPSAQVAPAPAETPDNLAITDIAVRGRAAAGAAGHLDIEVANFSKSPRTVQVEVSLDGHPDNVEKLCAARAKTRMPWDIRFAGKGWQWRGGVW